MIKIARASLPDGLTDRLAILTKEVTGAPHDARGIWERTSTRRHVQAPLGQLLRSMAPGLEQCMYCGESPGTSIDHFEPIGRNPLRTFDWLNHLLACTTCNSHKKRDRFPVAASGEPLLIDPTAEDPFDHLLLTLSLGSYEPLTDKGEATIEVCDLNRPLLQRGRVNARSLIEACLERWHSASGDGDSAMMTQMVRVISEQPFADVGQAMLRQALLPGSETIFSGSRHILYLLRLPEVRGTLLR